MATSPDAVALTLTFDLMVTADQNQQNLTGRKIALIVLGSNDWSIVRQHMDKITTAAQAAVMNSYAFIEMPLPPKRPYQRRLSE